MYSKCRDFTQAVLVFKRMLVRDVVSWTSVIATYAQMGREIEAIRSFIAMQSDGVRPNEHTYAEVISVIGDVALGEQIHVHVIHIGFISTRTVTNTLVTFYSRASRLSSADAVFREIRSKDIVSWSSIISAYAQEGYTEESFSLFAQMRDAGILPTEYQISSLFSTCASSAMLDAGRQLHALMIPTGVESDSKINSSLINMYSKCGMIDEAHRVFKDTGAENVVSWTAMINGYAEHGLSNEAISMFDSMTNTGLVPDQVAYIGVLTACSHAGLVDLGLRYFENMKHNCKIEPWKEHYGCIVDMLGRAGRLKEAENVIDSMPWRADEVVWTTMLRACAVHGDSELGQRAAERVLELEPECAGAHIALSNIYAAKGRWGEAAVMRRAMRGKGVRKEAGWSWIGIGDG
ncbi:putative pentatricopeptide repeat-containing protein At3g47840, partial [Asparagus officinalis]